MIARSTTALGDQSRWPVALIHFAQTVHLAARDAQQLGRLHPETRLEHSPDDLEPLRRTFLVSRNRHYN
jgi:hypothetical protein